MAIKRITDESPAEITYSLDHADHIIAIDGGWLEFARDNGAENLTLDNVENQQIWRYISDPDTRVIYRLLFDAVRTRTCTLSVTYRCDSPTRRRFMVLTCSPAPRLGISIRSRMLREETRPYVSTMDNSIAHAETVVKLCAWCKKCQVRADDWREIEEAISLIKAFDERLPPIVSHGMCPECHLTKIRQIRNGLHDPLESRVHNSDEFPPLP